MLASLSLWAPTSSSRAKNIDLAKKLETALHYGDTISAERAKVEEAKKRGPRSRISWRRPRSWHSNCKKSSTRRSARWLLWRGLDLRNWVIEDKCESSRKVCSLELCRSFWGAQTLWHLCQLLGLMECPDNATTSEEGPSGPRYIILGRGVLWTYRRSPRHRHRQWSSKRGYYGEGAIVPVIDP